MEQLEKYFDTAFGAPDGVKKLRDLILTLAMQGKLVKQNSKDTSADILIKEIAQLKTKLYNKGQIKAFEIVSDVKSEDQPYALPKGWKWVRLGDITEIIRGITFPAEVKTKTPGKNKVPCLRTSNVQKEIEWEDILHIDDQYIKKESQYIQENDIVMSMANSRELVGKVAIIRKQPIEPTTFGGFLGVIRTYKILPYYLLHLLNTTYARNSLIDTASQTTNIANVSVGKLNVFLIPLPSLEEQVRIVNKVDELLVRCDELEKLRVARDQKRLAVHSTAIRKMLDASDQENFDDAWQFITRHFGELYTVRENVAELRKAILQLAVMGKLVKVESTISHIPLKDLTTKIGSGSTPSGGKNAYHNSGTPLIRSMNVHFGGFVYGGLAFIDEAQAKKLNNVIVQPNDVLLNITGASIGRVAIAPQEMNGARVNQHVCILRTKDKLLPEFLEIFLSSPIVQNWIQDIQVGATREALTKAKIEEIKIPVPSVADQLKMIEKAKILLGICDDLELKLDLIGNKRGEVLGVVMANIN